MNASGPRHLRRTVRRGQCLGIWSWGLGVLWDELELAPHFSGRTALRKKDMW